MGYKVRKQRFAFFYYRHIFCLHVKFYESITEPQKSSSHIRSTAQYRRACKRCV